MDVVEYLKKNFKQKAVRCEYCEEIQKLGVCNHVFCEYLINEKLKLREEDKGEV